MSETIPVAEAAADPPGEPAERVVRYPIRHPELVVRIRTRANYLQQHSTGAARVPAAVATLARLRHAVGKPVGAVADVWEDTFGLVPDRMLGVGDEPSAAEQAAHHAMTLFALHRQGSSGTAQRKDIRFGRALRRLARVRSSDGTEAESVRRRFDALLTSTTADEGARHLRGIVTLLKSEEISLDYGLLANDLVDLWTLGREDAVRLRWARDYRRDRTDDPDESADATDSPTTEAGDTN